MNINNLNVTEFIISTTIRIETKTLEGICTGTGFFFDFCVEGNRYIPAIVTNKHVIQGAISGKLKFSLCDDSGNKLNNEFYDITIENFENQWIKHPISEIDLCILPIAYIYNMTGAENKKLFYTTLSVEDIPTEREIEETFFKIEEITTIGYPDGIWDEKNNIPIVRKGITATPLQLDFNGKPEFLIDTSIYGGSSGSPVYILNNGVFQPANNDRAVMGIRLKLLGIVYATYLHTVEGDIKIINTPVSKIPITQTQIPNNLGIVIHSRMLLDFEKELKKLWRLAFK